VPVELAGNTERPCVQVDVAPAQTEDLALAESGSDGEGVERPVAVLCDGVEERVDLYWRPRVDLAICGCWFVDEVDDVRGDLSTAHGATHRGVKDGVGVSGDGAAGLGLPLDRREAARHVLRRQTGQWTPPEVGLQVESAYRLVPVRRPRPPRLGTAADVVAHPCIEPGAHGYPAICWGEPVIGLSGGCP
jgi:hypothetical protein